MLVYQRVPFVFLKLMGCFFFLKGIGLAFIAKTKKTAMKQFTRDDPSPQAERNWRCTDFIILCTLPKTNKSPLKGHLKRTFHLNQPLIFSGKLAVSFSETPGIFSEAPGFWSETPGRRGKF